MIQKFIFVLPFCLLSLLVKAQNLGFSITEGHSKVSIPIEIYNNLIVVPVVLNGKLPLKFILDTGVRTTILTDKAFSDFLHMTYARKYTIAGPGGERLIDAYIANNVTIDMPGVHGEGHAMLVLDKDYLELRNYLGTDVHGILGYELFSRFIVEVDYQGKSLTLMLPHRFKPKRKYQKLKISVEDTKPYFFTQVEMNDSTRIQAKLLVDTGASHGLLLDPESDSKIKVPAKHINSLIGRGLGGVIMGQIGRIKNISIGSYTIPGVIANFPDPNSYNDSIKDTRSVFRNGSIGGEILSRFKIIFSFPDEKMYLKKNAAFKKEFHYNLSGLTVKAQGENLRNFEITNVRESSSADKAKVKVGDAILSIGGEAASELDLNRIDSMLNSAPGKTVFMEILRNGEKISVEFVLENQI
jgi:Aspartyl protease/PDZ domain